jgi:hypothetical protein
MGQTPWLEHSSNELPTALKTFLAKKHYCIVFNEVGKTIHDLDLLSDVFQSLHDATQGEALLGSSFLLY